MANNKKEIFSEKDQSLASFAKALSHPARIAILEVLAKNDECICGEIVEVLPLAQSTVSAHLKALKYAGLIKGTIDGPRSCYCINTTAFAKLEKQLNAFMSRVQKNTSQRCC